MNSFTLDGRNSLEWGVGLSGTGVWDAPVRRGTEIVIPGRNGAIWMDEGAYDPIDVKYPCWMARGFADKVDDFRAYLMAHADQEYRLEDTYHLDEFRLARYPGPFTAEPGTINRSGRFDVIFRCDPRRYLKIGEHELSYTNRSTFTINNPTYYDAYPIIRIPASLEGSVSFNGHVIQTLRQVNDLEVDCETMQTYESGAKVYDAVEMSDQPYLSPGRNVFVLGGVIQYITVIPRWWTI